jgi:hypothetical protein
MNRALFALAAPILFALAAPAAAEQQVDPLRFFAGQTETEGMVKIMFNKPFRSRSFGQGRIEPDGSLTLVQRVEDEGKPVRERRWRVRDAGRGHWTGAMSEAVGPVAIDQVGDRYRFRFKMKGNVAVEQWLAPLSGGKMARTITKARKFGMTVMTSEGTVRKLPTGKGPHPQAPAAAD